MTKKKKTTKKNNNSKRGQTNKQILDNLDNNTSMSSAIKCIVIVLVIFLGAYLLTLLILKKSSTDYIKKDTEKTSIQYSEIVAGTSFNKKDEKYLVFYYDKSDDDYGVYEQLYSNYKAKDEHLPTYYVDLSKSFNKFIVSDESNKNALDATELKVKNPTLIVFENNKISEYYEGEDEISNYVNK